MRTGQLIADRFEIERHAGEGGLAQVYRALDRHTGERVAVKILRQELGLAQNLDRFWREAAVLAELRHPAIVRYVAHGDFEGRGFLAMEWVEGQSLEIRLGSGPLSIDETIAFGAAVADALGAAHRRGVVHRDVKPTNVMLVGGEAGRVKVLDFGVARVLARAREVTRTGVVLGTVGYMAPEQARGEVGVDARADVFSLGCVLFRCLTGQPVFEGEDMISIMMRLVLEDAPRVSEIVGGVPEPLDDLIARMLSREPDARPSDGAAVAAELASLVARWAGRTPDARGPANPDGRAPGVAILSHERRVTSAIWMGAVSGVRPGAPSLGPVLDPFGGHADTLPDGSFVVTVGASGTATDRIARAARCAFAMRKTFPDTPIALLAGWGAGRSAPDALAGFRTPVSAPLAGAAVRLDEVAAGLLGARFDVAGDEHGLYLRGERDVVEAERLLLGRPTPCVGRDHELRLLTAVFDEVVSEPVARAVLVTGEGGVGKSRLCRELLRRVEARGPIEVWIGHGDPMSTSSPFALLAPALRRSASIGPSDPLEVQRRKIRARAGRHVARSELPRVAEFLGELSRVPFDDAESLQLRAARKDPLLMGDQVRRAFEDFLTAECAAHPVLIVLEDLHWGDLPSIRLLDSALRALAQEPLLVIALARPEVHALLPKIWKSRSPTEIKLGGLSPRWSERLVREMLGDRADGAIVDRVVELAAGNAFYLEELIRAVVAGRGGELPETVVAMVQAVLEDLDPEARRVLRAASVFGRSFGPDGVAALCGGRRATLDAWLSLLVDREVIERRTSHEMDTGDGAYAFRHAHVLETVYASLPEADRALCHRLAGEFLERSPDAARGAARLADHFERGGDLERAVAWYRRAAEHALEANDLPRAVDLAERGVDCGAQGEVFGALRLAAAEAHRWQGRNREGMLCAIDAIREMPRGSAGHLAALSEIASNAVRVGEHDTLCRLAEELSADLSVDAAGALPAPLLTAQILACTRVASPLLLLGRSDLAERLLTLAERLESRAALADPMVRARLLETRALRVLWAGESGAFLALAAEAAARFTEVGDLRNAAVQRANLGCVLDAVGAYAEAERELRDVLAIGERMGLTQVAAAARQNLAASLARMGRLDEARAMLEQSVAEAEAQGDRRLQTSGRIYLSLAAMLAGELEAAAEGARAAAEIQAEPTPMRAYALGVLSRALLALGRAAPARASAAEAMRVLDAVGGMEEGEALVRLADAEARRAVGDEGGARRAIAEARQRLLERATKIADPSWRRSFLERVAENRRTLELFDDLHAR